MIKVITPALPTILKGGVWEHETGFELKSYTFKRRPVILKYSIHTKDIKQAILWEKQIKRWSGKKKEALFSEDWEEIRKLARNYKEYPPSNPSTGSGLQ